MIRPIPLGYTRTAKLGWDESEHPRNAIGEFGPGGGKSVRDAMTVLTRHPSVKTHIRNVEDGGFSYVADMPHDEALSQLDAAEKNLSKQLGEIERIGDGKSEPAGMYLADLQYKEGQRGKQMTGEQWATDFALPEIQGRIESLHRTRASISKIKTLHDRKFQPKNEDE